MKAYLNGWSRMQIGVLTVGVALMVLGTAVAFAQTPAPSRTPPPPPDSAAASMPSGRPIVLSDQEIAIIIAMGEECVKAKGYQCAEAALMIKKKLEDSARPAPPMPAPPPPK